MTSERFDLIIDYHPHYKSLNSKLLKEAETSGYNDGSHYKGINDTSKFSLNLSSKTIDIIVFWVHTLLYNRYESLKGWNLEMKDAWFTTYHRGDVTVSHDHDPAYASWVYFVNTPKGSSPLVFTTSGKRIKAEEGKIVIFRSYVKHHVPRNNCDNRIVLVGNSVVLPFDLEKARRDATIC